MVYTYTPNIVASGHPEHPDFELERETFADYGDLCDDLIRTASTEYQDNVIAWANSEVARMGWACLVPNGFTTDFDFDDDATSSPQPSRIVPAYDMWSIE